MMNLLILLSLLQKGNNIPPVPKIPGEEYLDFSIIPLLNVTKVLYNNSYHEENIVMGINTVSLTVTKTGANPL